MFRYRPIIVKNLHIFLQMSTKFLQSDFVIMEQGILTVAHRSQHALTLKLSVSSVLYYCMACIKLTSSFPSVAFRLLSVELTGRSLSRICTSSYKWIQISSNLLINQIFVGQELDESMNHTYVKNYQTQKSKQNDWASIEVHNVECSASILSLYHSAFRKQAILRIAFGHICRLKFTSGFHERLLPTLGNYSATAGQRTTV